MSRHEVMRHDRRCGHTSTMNREASVNIQSAEAVALLGGDDAGVTNAGASSSSPAPRAATLWSSAFALPAIAAIYCAVLSMLSYQHKATALFALHPILLIFGVLFFMPLAVVRRSYLFVLILRKL